MNKKIIAVAVCIVVALAVIGVFQWKTTHWGTEEAQNAFESAAEENGDIESYAAAVEDEISNTAPQSGDAVDTSSTDTSTQMTETSPIEAAATYHARIVDGHLVIGSPDAPVKMIEYSSLSCPHCASFHEDTLPDLKKDYIDTGKVEMTFNDFPLNQQALSGTLLLKCLDATQRYEMMELLFKQQAQWAYEGDFQDKLKQYAALVGLPNKKADECMNDSEKEKAILQSMKQASEAHNVQSTPTFVLQPGNKVISGAAAYGAFSAEIEKLLAQ